MTIGCGLGRGCILARPFLALALQLAFDCFVDLPPFLNFDESGDLVFGSLLQGGVVD
ncbi:MAG: hypothetical protein HN783_13815 [Ilumatobacter sp.]|nr:hypothetical protein [Ilumatobacter sp.]